MSDTVATLIKITSALTSPQACIKYISIGVFICITLIWIEPALIKMDLPKDRLTIALSFVGVGTGALVGHILSLLYDFIYKNYKNRQDAKKAEIETKRNEALALEGKKVADERTLQTIKDSFRHLSAEQKEILRNLTLSEVTLDLKATNVAPLKFNQFIFQGVQIKNSSFLYKINPAIAKFIETQWDTEIKNNTDHFLSKRESSEILEILKSSNQDDTTTIISSKTLETLSRDSIPIRGSFAPDSPDPTYYFWFEHGYHEYLERFLGESFVQELIIDKNQIHFNT